MHEIVPATEQDFGGATFKSSIFSKKIISTFIDYLPMILFDKLYLMIQKLHTITSRIEKSRVI